MLWSPTVRFSSVAAVSLPPQQQEGMLRIFSHVIHSIVFKNQSMRKNAISSQQAAYCAPLRTLTKIKHFSNQSTVSFLMGKKQVIWYRIL